MTLQECMAGRYPVGMFVAGDPATLQALGVNVVIGEVDPAARDQLRRHGIVFFLNVNVFNDAERLADPSARPVDASGSAAPLDSWQKVVCPTHGAHRRETVAALVEKVRRLSPDGVSLDYIRYPTYWEMVTPDTAPGSLREFCFCDRCLDQFARETGVPVPGGLRGAAGAQWIRAHAAAAWTQWKCGVIAAMVREIRDAVRAVVPGIRIHIHAVPWRRDDFAGGLRRLVGQDLALLAPYVDVFGPMAYHHIVGRPVEWITEVVADMAGWSGKPVWPCVQVKEAYDKPAMTLAETEAAIRQGMSPPASGVVIFYWNEIKDSPERQAVLKRLVGG